MIVTKATASGSRGPTPVPRSQELRVKEDTGLARVEGLGSKPAKTRATFSC